MKVTPPQPRWISEEDGNPAYGKIIGVDFNPKDGYTLVLEFNGAQRRASLWGNNLKAAIEQMGDETERWMNRKFTAQFIQAVGGKTIRSFSFPA